MKNVVVVTTIKQGDKKDRFQRKRAEIFLDTAKEIAKCNMKCVALWSECGSSYLSSVRKLNVRAIPQSGKSKTIGEVRREAFRKAIGLYPEADYFFWIEPEKPDLLKHANQLVNLMIKEKSEMGLFKRIKMSNYPPEQFLYYLLCRTVATELIGFDFDYAFGPMILSKNALRNFLNYKGKYGDKWDSILIPRLRIIKNKKFSILPISFKNDRRMLALEQGNPNFILKRLEQLNDVIPSLINECVRTSFYRR